MSWKRRGRPRRYQPDPDLEVLNRFGRLVLAVIVLELAAFLYITGALRPLG